MNGSQDGMELVAYILAGGRSTRFGSDKARAMLHGEPLLVRLAGSLGRAGLPVLAVGQRDGQYRDLGIETIGDIEPGLGPVGGLRTALEHRRDGWCLVCSCDLTQWRDEWLSALQSRVSASDKALAAAFRSERWDPFPGLYHTWLLETHQDWRGGSMQRVLNGCNAAAVPYPPGGIQQANSPGDLPGTGR
jgi:molybdopterin-guanine dinucleotide biosynthesis protein A